MRIDAHHHVWDPARGDYDWMPKDDPILARPYSPADLLPHIRAAGIDGTVLVQAAGTVNETEYMLALADATPWILGVVGWIDFDNPADRKTLDRLARHPKFKGVRPMIQDIADDGWMLRDDVQWGYRALIEEGLTFDALGFSRHLANFLILLKRYPDMRVVVDHCMKPQIGARTEAGFSHWAEGMARLAGETGAYCKFSGLITEAPEDWTVEALQPYAEHIFRVFGAERIMWGSDWPVCLLRGSYADWRQAAFELTSELSEAHRTRIFGGTAAEFYGC